MHVFITFLSVATADELLLVEVFELHLYFSRPL